MGQQETPLVNGKWQLTSPEAVGLLHDFFNEKIGELQAKGAGNRYIQGNIEHFSVHPHPDEAGKWHSPRKLTIARELDSLRIVGARLHTQLPSNLLPHEMKSNLPVADYWSARVAFPVPRTGSMARAVLDTWRRPDTRLRTIALQHGVDSTAYQNMHQALYNQTDAADIPLGAVDVAHTVYGRDEAVNADARGRLLYLAVRISEATGLAHMMIPEQTQAEVSQLAPAV